MASANNNKPETRFRYPWEPTSKHKTDNIVLMFDPTPEGTICTLREFVFNGVCLRQHGIPHNLSVSDNDYWLLFVCVSVSSC
jgi:hypothetical protein